ncbi:YiiX/YebB-like N1pC/P60 family cysteine hydrolase [Akkermansiaceae bacterium]|nr:YiiX/YebB-like N1pC/P60 family cysteine hydrolase [bacterium]MDA7667175.1 YiiX/YebB-like N1pC/P60 family cysteine hydrolase [Akkermansiaceae bacterium]MDA8974910.1 YiiX/YebB-like N1pC/P60 family cysteine hydrolase [Akkermansiaceae bacterium]MDB4457376.1 YiiX/YebB-like N1pC/P60 family cysteine hydrolase [Akkermansiaceae bacterium]MDB4470599.1 YiiX/YebB-like N1pC/P60 family cysteine hydrolase [Akkermansiaceae bacterium]
MDRLPDEVLLSSCHILRGIRDTLPDRKNLAQEIEDADRAQRRGYYLPDEDERLRETYLRYLSGRSILWQMIDDLSPFLKSKDLRIFGLAFCAASILMRSSSYLIELAKERPIVLAKLDEAEPRYQIPRKTLTQIYHNLSSTRNQWRYRQARNFYENNRTQIDEALQDSDMQDIALWLMNEEPYFDQSKRNLFSAILTYRTYSLTRRTSSGYTKVMFHLFRLSGSAIAEMKQPFVKPLGEGKRVTTEIINQIRDKLQPGDIFVTRHDDAMSNFFLPGFWPHAALYMGPLSGQKDPGIPNHRDHSADVLEAKKDGVKLRKIEETLAVDSFVILRPKVSTEELQQALEKALTHEGKQYDFAFDFRKAERLCCTEVVYRAFYGIGRWNLKLIKQSGHLALPAEELIRQGLQKELIDVAMIFGVHGDTVEVGTKARNLLLSTLKD